jgi:hypothetical protein
MRLPDTESRRNEAPDSLAARYRPIDLTAFTPKELRRLSLLFTPSVSSALTFSRPDR